MTRTRTTVSSRISFAAGAFGIAAVMFVGLGAPAGAQGAPYPIVPAPANNPNPVPSVAAAQVPPTAAVAGVQVTTSTTAPTTVAASVVTLAPAPASVLGVTIEEQAEDVAFTGSESSRYTSLGVALTAIGAMLIGVSRRRRRSSDL